MDVASSGIRFASERYTITRLKPVLANECGHSREAVLVSRPAKEFVVVIDKRELPSFSVLVVKDEVMPGIFRFGFQFGEERKYAAVLWYEDAGLMPASVSCIVCAQFLGDGKWWCVIWHGVSSVLVISSTHA